MLNTLENRNFTCAWRGKGNITQRTYEEYFFLAVRVTGFKE